MTDAEREAMVQFFGTIHAQARQTDQQIVGNSQFIKPISGDIKNQLEHALHAHAPAPFLPPQHYAPPQHFEPPVIQQFQQPQQEVYGDFQLELPFNTQPVYNDEALKVLKEINLNLKKIASILENSNGNSKKIKDKQQD